MRALPRVDRNLSADAKIQIIYDWLYELSQELQKKEELANEQGSTVS